MKRHVLSFILGALVLQGIFLALSDIPLNTDSMAHHLGSKYAWKHPALTADGWYRPLPVLVFLAGAWAGYYGSVAVALLLSALLALQTAALARDLGLKRPAWVIPLLFLQVAFLRLSPLVMTESLFALLLVLGLRAERRGRSLAASALISLSALARLEGFFILGLWGLLALARKRWKEVGALAVGPALWAVLSTLALGSPFAALANRPYIVDLHFKPPPLGGMLRFFDEGAGPAVLVLLEVGAALVFFADRRESIWRKIHLTFGAIVFFAVFLYPNLVHLPKDYFPLSWPRHVASAAPWFALLALRGLNTTEGGRTARTPLGRALRAGLWLQMGVLAATVAFDFLRGKPYAPTLSLLALLTAAASLPFLLANPPPPRIGWNGFYLVLALLVILLKVHPIRSGPLEILTRQAVQWLKGAGETRPVVTALPGIPYLLGKDPFSVGLRLPGPGETPAGVLWAWDNRTAERWHRITEKNFEEGKFRVLRRFTAQEGRLIIYERTP